MALVEIREVSCSACRQILANHNYAPTDVITPEKPILNKKENVKLKVYMIMNEYQGGEQWNTTKLENDSSITELYSK